VQVAAGPDPCSGDNPPPQCPTSRSGATATTDATNSGQNGSTGTAAGNTGTEKRKSGGSFPAAAIGGIVAAVIVAVGLVAGYVMYKRCREPRRGFEGVEAANGKVRCIPQNGSQIVTYLLRF
jgi:hypothetical protein